MDINLEKYEDYHKEPFVCPICGKDYHWERGFNVHIKFHEKGVVLDNGKMNKYYINKAQLAKKHYKEVRKMADTFRKEYTPLDEEQKEKMESIKVKAQELLDLFDSTVTREERSDRSRCMAVARTNLETTIMWAIKGVTSAKVNTQFDNKA